MFSFMLVSIILLLILPGFKIKKEASPLTLNESTSIKGLLCLTIFFHHFSGWFFELDPILYFISHCGSFVVSVFFFLSAYGLSKSNKTQTVKDLLKRILKLFIPFWITDLLYLIIHFCMDIPLTVEVNTKNVLLSLLNLSEIISFSWFVSTIVFLYCIFFIIQKIKTSKQILLFFIILLVSSFITPTLWSTFFAFPIGLMANKYEKIFINLNKHRYLLCLLGLFVGTIMFITLKYVAAEYDNNVFFDKTADAVSGSLFALIVYLLLTKIHIGNKVLVFLGHISYEFYLVHGLGILFANKFFDITQPFQFFILALIFNLVISYAISKISKPVLKLISKL